MATIITNLQAILLASCFGAAACSAEDTPSAALLVLNKGDNSLAIVDPASGRVVARLPSGPNPHEVVASKGLAFYFQLRREQHLVSD